MRHQWRGFFRIPASCLLEHGETPRAWQNTESICGSMKLHRIGNSSLQPIYQYNTMNMMTLRPSTYLFSNFALTSRRLIWPAELLDQLICVGCKPTWTLIASSHCSSASYLHCGSSPSFMLVSDFRQDGLAPDMLLLRSLYVSCWFVWASKTEVLDRQHCLSQATLFPVTEVCSLCKALVQVGVRKCRRLCHHSVQAAQENDFQMSRTGKPILYTPPSNPPRLITMPA